MSTKVSTIRLRCLGNMTNNPADDRFAIDQITDSVDYLPGQVLKRSEVAELCDSKRWKVTIVPKRPVNF